MHAECSSWRGCSTPFCSSLPMTMSRNLRGVGGGGGGACGSSGCTHVFGIGVISVRAATAAPTSWAAAALDPVARAAGRVRGGSGVTSRERKEGGIAFRRSGLLDGADCAVEEGEDEVADVDRDGGCRELVKAPHAVEAFGVVLGEVPGDDDGDDGGDSDDNDDDDDVDDNDDNDDDDIAVIMTTTSTTAMMPVESVHVRELLQREQAHLPQVRVRQLALKPNFAFPIRVLVTWKRPFLHNAAPDAPQQMHVRVVGGVKDCPGGLH
jgi:hypothetical protein